jgi:cell division protein FtsL
MISDKWRRRLRKVGRTILYISAAIYLLVLLYDINSMATDITSIQSDVDTIQSNVSDLQGDVSSLQSDVSGIEGGSCSNNRICP